LVIFEALKNAVFRELGPQKGAPYAIAKPMLPCSAQSGMS